MKLWAGCILTGTLAFAQPAEKVTFLKDVLPLLNKSGCTSGPCHGAAKGKNGFKLSLRGADPDFDYKALLAAKQALPPHGGGLRFDPRLDKVIRQWQTNGAPFGDREKDRVAKLEVSPAELFFDKPGLQKKLVITATYLDGSTRDVSAEANLRSNAAEVASTSSDNLVSAVRNGEAALLVRYEGKFAAVPVTVLNPKEGFVWSALPQHNYIDQLIDAKLKPLKIQPSPLATDAEFLRRVSLDLIGLPPTPAELHAFLAETGDPRQKRSRAIDRLMQRPEFVNHWSIKGPYDKRVHDELLTDDPKLSMEKMSQTYLGVRMVCAQCHDHPFAPWTRSQYQEMSASFAPERREAFADWLTSKSNPHFPKAIANRLWGTLTGRGIIEPVDDIRASNPPTNEALLTALTKDLTDHDFDLRHLIRTIVNSRTYQTSSETNDWNAEDKVNFSHAVPRRLTPDQLIGALTLATGSSLKFAEKQDASTVQDSDPHTGRDAFVDRFGRPLSEPVCECELRTDLSLPQTLKLASGGDIATAVNDPKGRIANAVTAGLSDDDLIEEMYLAALSRLPNAKELEQAATFLRSATNRTARAQDLLWALINSKAFLYNR